MTDIIEQIRKIEAQERDLAEAKREITRNLIDSTFSAVNTLHHSQDLIRHHYSSHGARRVTQATEELLNALAQLRNIPDVADPQPEPPSSEILR